MMPQNWTGGDNWSLSSIHSSFWWPLLTSSPGRWSVKVTAEPSSVPVHKPLRLQTVVAVPSASHRDWGHTAINFPASLSLGHQTLQSHRGSKHLPTWNTCSKSDERSRVWRLLLSAFSNAAKFFISPLRDVLGEQVVTCDRGPNVVPAPAVIKSASDGTSSALDSSHFHFQGYEVQSRGLPGNAGVGTLLRPLPSPAGGGLALPRMLSLPEHLARSAPADCAWEVSPLPLSSQERGSSADGGTRTRTWTTPLVSGSRAGWLRPFSHVHLSQQKAPRVVVPGPAPLLHKVARFQVSQVQWV